MKPVMGLFDVGVNTIKFPLSFTVTFAFDSIAPRASLSGPRGVNPQVINPIIPRSTTTPMMMRAVFKPFFILAPEILCV